jgi:hypothetical protein
MSMNAFDKIPAGIKAAIFVGIMLIGPVMVCSLWFGGVTAGMIAILAIIVYFSFLYIVGVRRYMSGD